MTRLVFLDLDGTVINSYQQVPKSALQACQTAVSNGHILWMCTGRCWLEIYPWLWDVGFQGFIGGNGTHGLIDERYLFDHRISGEQIQQLDEYFLDRGIRRVWQTPNDMHPSEGYMQDFFAGNEDAAREWADYLKQVEPYYRSGTPTSASKCMFVIPQDSPLEIEDVARDFEGVYEIIPSSVDTGVGKAAELGLAGISKGTGLREVVATLGITLEDTVAVGDSLNDLDMLKTAGLGIAMGNAKQAVKDCADWVSTSINEDGLANALRYAGVID